MAGEKAALTMRLNHKLSLLTDFARYTLRPLPVRERNEAHRRKRVLVIRLDRIGDFALFLPFAAALRRIYPPETHEITLLGRPLWMPLARQLGFDRCTELDPAAFLTDARYRREQLKRVAAEQFDLLLQPRFYREVLVEDLLALAVRAPQSIAFASIPDHLHFRLMRFAERAYTRRIDSGELRNAHELLRNRCFLNHLETDNETTCRMPQLQLPPLPAELSAAPYVVFLPGSGKSEKVIWPPENFGRIARKAEEAGYAVVVCGTADESPLAETLLASCRRRQHNLTGRQSIEEFTATIRHAQLVIGNDTGGIHLAAMSGIPALTIAGQGQPGIFLPYPENLSWLPGVRPPRVISGGCPHAGCRWQCVYSGKAERFHCIRAVAAERVQKELETRLPVLDGVRNIEETDE